MVLKGQHISQALIVIKLGNGAPFPRSSKVKSRAMFAPTFTRTGVAGGALEAMGFSENV